MPRRVLVVEDNRDIAHLLELHLKEMGCEVRLAFDGTTGLSQARSKPYDLIILDRVLPGIEGLDIIKHLRSEVRYVPILMLTARATELDRVLGLEIGADDYLAKPFSVPELLARVKALLRRSEALSSRPDAVPATIRTGPFYIDAGKRSVRLSGQSIDLTAKEFDLLLQFARTPGRAYTRSELLDLVWGYGHDGYEHTVNSHINRLRAKIEEDPSHPRFLLTVWGVGYKFAEPDSGNEE